MNINKKNFFISISIMIICILGIIGFTKSDILENDVEVKEQTDLTYYLDISYDGVDKFGVESSSTKISEINSGYIYVEDKIPEGLVFNGFVTTEDGSIGAVKRSDGSSCPGKVVDDTDGTETLTSYHGLHYDETTRTVSFKVKNLMAGCVLTVGIKTITPTIDDPNTAEVETRRDFYNFASAREDSLTVYSNTVHAWMGNEFIDLYQVNYEYTGTVPDNAPALPSNITYASGSSVPIASDVSVEGYDFSGWTTTDATITNGKFTMPTKNVTLKGSFTGQPTYKVSYKISGTTPSGYVVPSEKTYYEKSTITVDSLKKGDVFNGYRFLGWTTTDVTIDEDNSFSMPNKNVTITGAFEEVTYKVSYAFYDTVLPSNSDALLPATKEYKPGSTVTLSDVNDVTGYNFLGWYKENTFTMPEEDIVVYGEWSKQKGIFEPTIKKEIITTKPYYRSGDIVKYKVTITNTASYAIKEVIIKEENENAYFIAGTNYEVTSNKIVTIPQIAANSSVEVFAEYKVTLNDTNKITNTVSIIGALADNDYVLNTEKEYKASASFGIQSQVKVCKVAPSTSLHSFQFKITGTDNDYETWLVLNANECTNIYVDPGKYNIQEIIPQEYSLSSVTGAVTSNNSTLTAVLGKNYEMTFTNEYKKKGFLHSFGRVENIIIGG